MYLGLTSKGMPYVVINVIALVIAICTIYFFGAALLIYIVTLLMTVTSVSRDTAVVNATTIERLRITQ